jgi:hypothetical protein
LSDQDVTYFMPMRDTNLDTMSVKFFEYQVVAVCFSVYRPVLIGKRCRDLHCMTQHILRSAEQYNNQSMNDIYMILRIWFISYQIIKL